MLTLRLLPALNDAHPVLVCSTYAVVQSTPGTRENSKSIACNSVVVITPATPYAAERCVADRREVDVYGRRASLCCTMSPTDMSALGHRTCP